MENAHIFDIVLASLLALLGGGLAWLLKSVISNGKKVDAAATDADVDQIRERVAALEATLETMDVRTELGKVHTRVDDIGSDVSEVKGELTHVSRTVGLIQQHLMGSNE